MADERTAIAPDRPDERAMEEWKQLEVIIGRYEGQEFQVRGWMFVLLGVLGAALFADKPKLSGVIFSMAGGGLICIYCWMELIIRIPKRKAYKRVEEIESALRGECVYDGPRIGLSLDSAGFRPGLYWAELRKLRVWSFYASVFAVVVILGFVSN